MELFAYAPLRLLSPPALVTLGATGMRHSATTTATAPNPVQRRWNLVVDLMAGMPMW